MRDGSLLSWIWFSFALFMFVIEAIRPGRFALWLGFAAILVGVVASVARWPWPAEAGAWAVLALLMLPAWRRYERKA
jgi:membrane protein implicated in regulation of membrane protease activity